MARSTIIALLILGIIFAACSVLLRVGTAGKYEIKTIDIVFLIIPLLVVALATGRVKGFDMFGVKADLSELWANVARSAIEHQVVPASPASVEDVVAFLQTAEKVVCMNCRIWLRKRSKH